MVTDVKGLTVSWPWLPVHRQTDRPNDKTCQLLRQQ